VERVHGRRSSGRNEPSTTSPKRSRAHRARPIVTAAHARRQMFAPIGKGGNRGPVLDAAGFCDHREVVDLILVNGLPGSGKTTLANGLARLLDAPLIVKDAIKEAVADVVTAAPGPALGMAAGETMWTLAAAMSGTVVLESWWFRPRDLRFVEAGLRRCRPTSVVEVWCEVPSAVAKSRYAARQRHRIHDDQRKLADAWPRWEVEAEPLGVGPVVRVDTRGPVRLADVADQIVNARL
jgi:predicted kinase